MTAQGFPTTSGEVPAHRSRRTLAEALGSPDNALNLVRLVLAVLVILGHAFPLGGFGSVRLGPFVHAGLHGQAVEGFFVISGYLILASALRMPALPYLWRRVLRIYPGYLVALLVTAFVIAPIGAGMEPGARWVPGSAARYVLGALDLKPSQDGIERTLVHVPWPSTWNGSLWTLFYEATAYLGIVLLVHVPVVRAHLRTLIPALVVLGTGALVLIPGNALEALPGPLPTIAGNGLRLWTCFAWGMLAHRVAPRVRPRAWIAVVAVVVHLLVVHAPMVPEPLSRLVQLPALTVAVLMAGALLPWRLGSRYDISYGMYVYAFPIQQLLILAGIARYGWPATALMGVLCTIPLAWLSWIAIERPALSCRDAVPVRHRPQEDRVDAA